MLKTTLRIESGKLGMKITDEARDFINMVLKQSNKRGIRLYFAGFG
jgi:hypothetical protein